MNKKGAFKEMIDFVLAIFLLVLFLFFSNALSGCIHGNTLSDVSPPKNQVKNTQELLVLLKTPMTYEGERGSVSDFLVQYYYSDSKSRGKLKEALQDTVEKFARENGKPVYKDEYCWLLLTRTDDDERLLALWDPDCRSNPSARTTCIGPSTMIPLSPGSPHTHLFAHFSNEINQCLNGVQET